MCTGGGYIFEKREAYIWNWCTDRGRSVCIAPPRTLRDKFNLRERSCIIAARVDCLERADSDKGLALGTLSFVLGHWRALAMDRLQCLEKSTVQLHEA